MSLSGSSSTLPGGRAAEEAKTYTAFLAVAAVFLLLGVVCVEVQLAKLYNVISLIWPINLGG